MPVINNNKIANNNNNTNILVAVIILVIIMNNNNLRICTNVCRWGKKYHILAINVLWTMYNNVYVRVCTVRTYTFSLMSVTRVRNVRASPSTPWLDKLGRRIRVEI